MQLIENRLPLFGDHLRSITENEPSTSMDRLPSSRREKTSGGSLGGGRRSIAQFRWSPRPTNVSYLTGFSGDSSVLVLGRQRDLIVSDGRFTTQLAQECPDLEAHIREPGQERNAALGPQSSKPWVRVRWAWRPRAGRSPSTSPCARRAAPPQVLPRRQGTRRGSTPRSRTTTKIGAIRESGSAMPQSELSRCCGPGCRKAGRGKDVARSVGRLPARCALRSARAFRR